MTMKINERVKNYKFKVRLGDTDIGGIVYYPNFYKWMDEATHEYLAAIGSPSSKLFSEQQIGIPLLEAKCNIKSPLFFEDKVLIQSTVEELHNKVFKISHVFLREEQNVAEGYEIRAWASFDGKLKTHPIPQEIRQKMMAEKEAEVE